MRHYSQPCIAELLDRPTETTPASVSDDQATTSGAPLLPHTVSTHLRHVFEKLAIASRHAADRGLLKDVQGVLADTTDDL